MLIASLADHHIDLWVRTRGAFGDSSQGGGRYGTWWSRRPFGQSETLSVELFIDGIVASFGVSVISRPQRCCPSPNIRIRNRQRRVEGRKIDNPDQNVDKRI